MFKPWNRLTILLVATVMGALLMAPCFSFANDDTNADPAPTRSGEPKATGHIRSNYGEATVDTPAEGRMVHNVWLGFYEIPIYLDFAYENLPDSNNYRVDVKGYNIETGDKIKDHNQGNYQLSGDGSMSFDTSVMGPLMPGDYRFEFKLYDENDSNKTVVIQPEADMSFNLHVTGVCENKILVDGDTLVDNTPYNIATRDKLDEGCQITHSLKLKGVDPNETYNLTAYFARVNLPSSFMNNIERLKQFTGAATSDAEGNLSFVTDLDVNDQLEDGKVYTVIYQVTKSNQPRDRYAYMPGGNDKDFIGLFSLDSSYLIPIKVPEAPETTKTQVDVNISNYISGTKAMLKGANLKIVKGNDPDGEEVESWTVGDKPHITRLEVGEYTLVQTDVPSGYTLADPIHFTVKDVVGSVKGSNFIAYRVNSNWETDSAEGFYLKEETSHDGSSAYCVNDGLNNPTFISPDTAGLLYYKEIKLEDDESFARLLNPRYDKERTLEALKGIVYAGYPEDGAGLKGKYSLSDNEFENVTQAAVHYYTDSIQQTLGPSSSEYDFNGNQRQFDAYNEMISGTLTYPKGMTVRLYIPATEGYQSLIATKFEETGTAMRLVIYNDKPPEVQDDTEKERTTEESKEDAGDKEKNNGKQNGKHSNTGDNTHLWMWIAIFLIAGLAFVQRAMR